MFTGDSSFLRLVFTGDLASFCFCLVFPFPPPPPLFFLALDVDKCGDNDSTIGVSVSGHRFVFVLRGEVTLSARCSFGAGV